MSGVDTTLQRQLGVKTQVDMIENVIWFKWEKQEPFDAQRVYAAVVEGGMGLTALRILGQFSFEKGHAKSNRNIDFDYTGETREAGLWDVEITGYENQGGRPKVSAVKPYVEPKIYNANK